VEALVIAHQRLENGQVLGDDRCDSLPVAVSAMANEAAPVLGSGVRRRENGMILIIGFRKRF
jgi:hypothetical protein